MFENVEVLMPILAYIEMNMVALFTNVLLLSHNKRRKIKMFSDRYFAIIIEVLSVIIIADSISWLIEGGLCVPPIVHRVVMSVYYLGQTLIPMFLLYYNMSFLERRIPFWGSALLSVPVLVGFGIIIYNFFTPFIFIIDEAGLYQRYTGFIYIAIPPLLLLIFCLICAVVNCVKANKEEKYLTVHSLVFTIIIIVGSILSALFYGFEVWPIISIAFVYLYLNVHAKREADLEEEVRQKQVSIMMSQIQPHFLYNCLATIELLCTKEPERAKEATHALTMYLRRNLDSLKEETPIPFEKEMEHVKNYLTLELIRFEDKLSVKYDLQVTDFTIPCLSIQPLVENAVKYGVRAKNGPGTVTIETFKEDTKTIIRISDDGIGFDKNAPKKEETPGRSHVGIENVRSRLKLMLNADLVIDSELGKGTTVTIVIP